MRRPFFYALTALMAYIAAERLAFVFPHLAGGLALDLGSRTNAVELWFGGEGLYGRSSSTYPPASHLMLWPTLGWLPWESVSQLWALLCALSLGILALLCVRHEAIASHSMRWFAAMTMLAITATSSIIWLGQLASLVLVALFGAVALLFPRNEVTKFGWARELGAGALLLLSLVKPSVAAPFLWMVLWAPRDAAAPPLRRRVWVGIGIVVGYGLLTLLALRFQNEPAREVAVWAQTVNRNGAQLSEGYLNLRAWLTPLGVKSWSHPLALLVLLWLGWWTFRHRHLDQLLLLSVTATIARLWTYHNIYDDLLLAIPMLFLLQIGLNSRERARKWGAIGLLTLLIPLLLLPPDWMFDRPPFALIAQTLFGLTSVAMLFFLLRLAKAENNAPTVATNTQRLRAL